MKKRNKLKPQLRLGFGEDVPQRLLRGRVRVALLVWVDILGCRNLIKQAEQGDGQARRTLGRIAVLLERLKTKEIFEFTHSVQNFSDTILLTVPLSPDYELRQTLVYQLPFVIARMQREFILANILLRGSVCLGRVYHAGSFKTSLFMESLFEAESLHAKVPRILCSAFSHSGDSEMLDLGGEHIDAWEQAALPGLEPPKVLRTDSDGRRFVDYLLEPTESMDVNFLMWHKRVIETTAAKFQYDARILSKLRWMADYHNAVLDSIETENNPSIIGQMHVRSSVFPLDLPSPFE